ncbi:MAG: glycosyltransferase [Syntrophomonadaceae bacterium]|jgi:glycosyltransferase involved in cell wall biosynthesis|nr:glycosyltransferase [Syntrophomonadaceae bacterium]
MMEAFRAIGYEVEPVVGYGSERRKAINDIKRAAKQGKRYDFVYSESSTMPTLLTEPHHVPTYPALDFNFFSWARARSIPIGLFYRDVHWRYSYYRDSLVWFKKAISLPLYYYDLANYRSLVDHLFLPSIGMSSALPIKWNRGMSALPPGVSALPAVQANPRQPSNELELLYVGGIKPPLYDLSPLFETVRKVGGVRLTLCCRQPEWESVGSFYRAMRTGQVRTVHVQGAELRTLYLSADIFVLLRNPHEYIDFAMPVKVFESLGYGVPILTLDGTEAARFIREEGIGWVVGSVDEACGVLQYLRDHREEVDAMKERLSGIRLRHTWEERARHVARTLTGQSQGGGEPS